MARQRRKPRPAAAGPQRSEHSGLKGNLAWAAGILAAVAGVIAAIPVIAGSDDEQTQLRSATSRTAKVKLSVGPRMSADLAAREWGAQPQSCGDMKGNGTYPVAAVAPTSTTTVSYVQYEQAPAEPAPAEPAPAPDAGSSQAPPPTGTPPPADETPAPEDDDGADEAAPPPNDSPAAGEPQAESQRVVIPNDPRIEQRLDTGGIRTL